MKIKIKIKDIKNIINDLDDDKIIMRFMPEGYSFWIPEGYIFAPWFDKKLKKLRLSKEKKQ
jgi:hypothetical protein